VTDKPSILSARRGGGYVALVDDLAYTYEGVCSRDSIAAALAEHLSGSKPHIRSAGSGPAGHINPS
jgi:hypothetical protein